MLNDEEQISERAPEAVDRRSWTCFAAPCSASAASFRPCDVDGARSMKRSKEIDRDRVGHVHEYNWDVRVFACNALTTGVVPAKMKSGFSATISCAN
jgi:hypothetical protein